MGGAGGYSPWGHRESDRPKQLNNSKAVLTGPVNSSWPSRVRGGRGGEGGGLGWITGAGGGVCPVLPTAFHPLHSASTVIFSSHLSFSFCICEAPVSVQRKRAHSVGRSRIDTPEVTQLSALPKELGVGLLPSVWLLRGEQARVSLLITLNKTPGGHLSVPLHPQKLLERLLVLLPLLGQ